MKTAQLAREIILEYQRAHNIPDYIMCNTFAWTERDWDEYKNSYARTLTIYEQIMFMELAHIPLP